MIFGFKPWRSATTTSLLPIRVNDIKELTAHGKVTINGQNYNFTTGGVNNGYLTEEEYLASVELGNEIVEGNGETVFRSYSVTIR